MLRELFRSIKMGVTALFAINAAGAFTGVTLGYSWLCITVAGILGVPGVVLLVLMDMIMK